MLETIALAFMVVAFIVFVVALAILFPFLRREAQADAEEIRAARLQPTRTDHDTT